MRAVAALVCAMALMAPGAVLAQNTAGWTSDYTDGVVTATERDDHGRVTATITCRPPDGVMVLSDFTLANAGRRAQRADVKIGNLSVNIPSRVEGRGRDQALRIDLPQRPPILAAVQPNDHITITVNRQTRELSDGSAVKMKEVAYGCWGS
ncbi:MAG TPA: hypothetical protein VHC73_15385 [Vitreimonas sp.]|nr:hypothetical protein [Vitreimonas sp.]